MITETQLLVFDLLLGSAFRALKGEFKKVLDASPEELEELKKKADSRFDSIMDKIHQH